MTFSLDNDTGKWPGRISAPAPGRIAFMSDQTEEAGA